MRAADRSTGISGTGIGIGSPSNSTGISVQGSGNESVRRVVAIIEMVASRGGTVPLREICEQLGIARSTMHTIVQELVRSEWLVQGVGGVSTGTRLSRLTGARRDPLEPWASLQPILDELRDTTGETVQLSILDQGQVLVVAVSNGTSPISVSAEIGTRVPVNWSAAGRLLVADMDDADLRIRLPKMIRASTFGKAPTDISEVLSEIRGARRTGTAWQVNRTGWHTGAVAAPVRNGENHCLATISIVVPKHRLDDDRKQLLLAVRYAAERASEALKARSAEINRS